MTKFKGSILSRKLEADPNCPVVPMYGDTNSHLWTSKQPFVTQQMPQVAAANKNFYPNGAESNDTDPEDSASSPIMDLTMSMSGQQQGADSAHQQRPQQQRTSSPRGFSESTGSSDNSTVHHNMLGQYMDSDRTNTSVANKFASAASAGAQQYRQPWDSSVHSAPTAAATRALPHEQHLASPTSSAFMSNSDSTPSTLVLATLKKRKRKPQPIPEDCKDDAYWERRKRNNESAKRSREMRRIKEQQTTMRVIYLEQENLRLKTETDMLRSELEKLRELLYNRNSFQNGV